MGITSQGAVMGMALIAVTMTVGAADQDGGAVDRFDAVRLLEGMKDADARTVVSRVVAEAGSDAVAAARLSETGRQAYWKRKDVALSVAILRAGIERGNLAAGRLKETDPERAKRILGDVKMMAYNLASFTWPGWGDVSVPPEYWPVGREAAALNLKLAIDLHRPREKLADAHWLVGAHELAAKDYPAAEKAFAAYRENATTAEHRASADGYAAIAKLAAGRAADGDRAFAAAVATLKQLDPEDARAFADQLATARGVFVR